MSIPAPSLPPPTKSKLQPDASHTGPALLFCLAFHTLPPASSPSSSFALFLSPQPSEPLRCHLFRQSSHPLSQVRSDALPRPHRTTCPQQHSSEDGDWHAGPGEAHPCLLAEWQAAGCQQISRWISRSALQAQGIPKCRERGWQAGKVDPSGRVSWSISKHQGSLLAWLRSIPGRDLDLGTVQPWDAPNAMTTRLSTDQVSVKTTAQPANCARTEGKTGDTRRWRACRQGEGRPWCGG